VQLTSPAALGLTSHRIALPTGVELHYVEQGDPHGEVLIFLHGFTGSWRSWELNLPHISLAYHTYALSQRGHGDSAKPACCYRPADFAADVIAWMDVLGIRRATLIGHSLGSFIAHSVAVDHPERVARLVLIGWGPISPTTPAAAARVSALHTYVQQQADQIDPAFVRQSLVSTTVTPIPVPFLETVVAESLRVPLGVWQQMLASRLAADPSTRLGPIQAKTLVLYGDHDVYCLEGQQALAAVIKEATFITYPAAGHAPHWERPQRFVDDLHAFLT
jgi:pimeloyl-ACP methyl ester carboxylesterase